MKVIIAGSRDLFPPWRFIQTAVTASGFRITELVCGMGDGVDEAAFGWARSEGIPIAEFPAEWEKHKGPRRNPAGPIRNRAMAEYAGSLGGLIAIYREGPSTTPGTSGMITLAGAKGLIVWEHVVRPGQEAMWSA